MQRYSVSERIGRALTAVIMLLVVLGFGYALAPRAVFETPIGQLTAGQAFLAALWATILMQCLSGVGVLLFEAIAGRARIKDEDEPSAESERAPVSGPGPTAEPRQFPLPWWLKRDRPWRAAGVARRKQG
jgi:hypothetical protein